MLARACGPAWVALAAACGASVGPVAVRRAARLARAEVPPVSWPLAGTVGAALFGLLAWRHGVSAESVALMGFACVLAVLSLVDLAERRIPNVCVLQASAMRVAVLVVAALAGDVSWGDSCARALVGAVVTCAPAALLALATCLLRGRPGVGGGDLKLLAVVGLYAGWWDGLLILFAASVMGVASTLATPRRSRTGPTASRASATTPPTRGSATFAFGPPIALSCVFWMLFSKKPFI